MLKVCFEISQVSNFRAVKYYYDIKEGKINSLEKIVIDLTQNKYEVTKEDVDRVLRYIEELEEYIN